MTVKITLLSSSAVTDAAIDVLEPLPGELTYPADHLAEEAGRACYQSWSRPNPQTAQNADYLSHVIELGHESVLAHAAATFYLEGVSRSLTHELIRHRFLVFSELSQRYVNVAEAEVVVPPLVRDGEGEDFERARSIIALAQDHARRHYAELVSALEDAIGTKREDRKRIREAARAVMPGGLETKIVVSGNLRAWRDFLRQRRVPWADAEIRELAEALLVELVAVAPASFQDRPGVDA